MVILFNLRLLFYSQFGASDLAHLETEQIKLLRVSLFIDNQRRLLLLQSGAPADQPCESLARRTQVPEGVEDAQLFCGVEQRLMVVRAMNIDQPLAQRAEDVQGGGRAVYELAVCSRRAK